MAIPLTYKEALGLDTTLEWSNIRSIHTTTTHRGTKIDMVERPHGEIACYMNETIQSCMTDEAIYHEALVHPIMASATSRKRVMIIGGGEGATAREVFKWPEVEQVDMYEWDKDVVNWFTHMYPQWAKGVWANPKLHLHYEDIFEAIQTYPTKKYDVVIIDLFDMTEETMSSWSTLLEHLPDWVQSWGSVVMYAGMRQPADQVSYYQRLMHMIQPKPQRSILTQLTSTYRIYDNEIIPYKVFIPSFLGESVFLLLKSHANVVTFEWMKKISHITKEVWKSYKTNM